MVNVHVCKGRTTEFWLWGSDNEDALDDTESDQRREAAADDRLLCHSALVRSQEARCAHRFVSLYITLYEVHSILPLPFTPEHRLRVRMQERLMYFPTWIDLKGEDSVPETVHHVVHATR